jgi:hypothetical protein
MVNLNVGGGRIVIPELLFIVPNAWDGGSEHGGWRHVYHAQVAAFKETDLDKAVAFSKSTILRP